MSTPQTKPTSRAHRLVALVTDLATSHQRGVTVAEIRDAWREAEGEVPPSLLAEIGSLTRRGALRKAGGRVGHLRYAPPGVSLLAPDATVPPDDVDRVLAACCHAVDRLGRPVATREVQAELAQLGLVLARPYPNAVRTALKTLARPKVRGPAEQRQPLREITLAFPSGRTASTWARADVLPIAKTPIHAVSAAEAMRQAVDVAVQEFGRPVRRLELLWWLRSRAKDERFGIPVEEEALGRRLADIVHADAKWKPTRPLQEIATRWTCYGGPALRYAVGAVTPTALAVAEWEDAVIHLRVADEVTSLQSLARRALLLRSRPLEALHREREPLVSRILSRLEAELPAGEAVRGATRAQRLVERLVASSTNPRTIRIVHEWRRHIEAAATIPPRTGGRSFPLLIGPASGIDDAEVARWRAALRASTHGSERALTSCLEPVRRVRVPSLPDARIGKRTPARLSTYDRVDFFAAVYGVAPAPRTWALLEGALSLLGPILRDPDVIEQWRNETRPGTWESDIAAAALGLLGAYRPRATDHASPATTLAALLVPPDAPGHAESSRMLPTTGLEAARIAQGFLLTALE